MTGFPKLGSVLPALIVALAFVGCSSDSNRGSAGLIDTHGGSASDSIGVGGCGGSVSLEAGDNIYIRAGDIPDPEFSSTDWQVTGEADASTMVGNGLTNTSANGIRTLTFVQNFVIQGTLTNSVGSETLLVINAPTIHVLGAIDLAGGDSNTVATRGTSVSLNATEPGGEIFVLGQIDTSGGSGPVAGRGGNVWLNADNCGTSISSPGLTSEGNVIMRGKITTNGGNGEDDGEHGGSVAISACNDIFLEMLPIEGITTYGGSGNLLGGDAGDISASASNVDTNGSLVIGGTILSANGGSGRDGGHGGDISLSLAPKSGNTGTGDLLNQARIISNGGSGTGGGQFSDGGDGGDVWFTTYDSGQNIENEGSIDTGGGSASGQDNASAGHGGDVYITTDSDNNDLGGMIRNSGTITTDGGSGVLFGGDAGDIMFDTDPNDGEDASNGEGENLGNLNARGGDANNNPNTSSVGGDGGLIWLRARGAFQSNASFDALGGSGVTEGSAVIPIVD